MRSICLLMILLAAACQNRPDPLAVHQKGLGLAKVYLEKEKGYAVDDLTIRGTDDIQNLQWQRFWAEIEATGVTPSAEMVHWNDRMHTLYAVYFNPLDPDAQAIWVFCDRGTGEVAGSLPTVSLHNKKK